MSVQIENYRSQYKGQIVKLFEDFQDYLTDLDSLKRLTRKPGYGEHTTEQTLKEVAENEGVFYLALDQEKVVGFIVGVIERMSEEDLLGAKLALKGRVTELYINQDYRGKGLGTRLMDEVEKYFKEKGCNFIWVEVFAPNIGARALYERLGFMERDLDLVKNI